MALNVDFNVWVSALVAWLLNPKMSWDYFWLWLVLEIILVMPLGKKSFWDILPLSKRFIVEILQNIKHFSFFRFVSHSAAADQV